MKDSTFLETAYDHPGESSAEYYDRWAASYDSELTAQDYATPRRCAEALVAAGADTTAPLLDYGCGTGLSGAALAEVGFEAIDGWDPSEGMLAEARARGVYRELTRIDLDAPLPTPEPPYPAIVAAGVIGPNVAPPETIDGLLERLPSGGILAFSLNDHALAAPGFEARAVDWIDCGGAELIARDYGDHIPGIGLGAAVLVLRRR